MNERQHTQPPHDSFATITNISRHAKFTDVRYLPEDRYGGEMAEVTLIRDNSQVEPEVLQAIAYLSYYDTPLAIALDDLCIEGHSTSAFSLAKYFINSSRNGESLEACSRLIQDTIRELYPHLPCYHKHDESKAGSQTDQMASDAGI